jgi:DNA polymerase-4
VRPPGEREPPAGPEPVPAWPRTILHVDMDAFFASVEILDDPSLRGRPLIVGGDGARGVVASASYEARRYGIHSAMPSAVARRLCPGAVFRPGRYSRYEEMSGRIHDVFQAFTPRVEGIGLDEAFLDVSGAGRLFGPPREVALAVRAAISAATALTCSVGAATTKFVAKLASEAAKPRADERGVREGDGILVVPADGVRAFLHPLPIEALWGVGPATAERLKRLGILTVGDLAAVPLDTVEGTVGRAAGRHLHALAHGLDPRPVEVDRPTKSIGHEETFQTDRTDRAGLSREVVRMADAVAARVRRSGLAGRTVHIKVRFADFTTITRSKTVGFSLETGPAVARVAGRLLDAVDVTPGVRLLGVSVSGFAGEAGPGLQLSLDLGAEPVAGGGGRPDDDLVAAADRWRAATGAIDQVRARFGDRAVGPAVLVDGDGLHVGRGDNKWEPVADE